MEIDVEGLRKYLMNYFGTATMYPQLLLLVDKIKSASENELVAIAESYNIDISDFIINKFQI